MTSFDAQMFNEFLAFKKFKEEMAAPATGMVAVPPRPAYAAVAAAVAAAPARSRDWYERQSSERQSSERQSAPQFQPQFQPQSQPRPPRELDYEYLMRLLLSKMCPIPGSKNPRLFWMFKNLYEVMPECFSLTGKAHLGSEGTEHYMSFQFRMGVANARAVNFHAFGEFTQNPYRFIINRIDIIMMGGEIYKSAAVFTDLPLSSGTSIAESSEDLE